jgi:agmatine deiminase
MKQLNRREFILASLASISAVQAAEHASDALDGSEDEKANYRPDYTSTKAKLLTESTPLADGFYMPGEEMPHEATLMVFPQEQNWEDEGIDEVRKEWVAVAHAIADHEKVRMVVHPRDKKAAQKVLDSEIELLEFPVNDGWARDTGPLFLVNKKGERRATGFHFNGWGAKFPPFSADALLKARLCAHMGMPFYPLDVVSEGGAVLVDGDGTLIVTEECLLHKNRNPNLSKEVIEKRLLDGLGAKSVIWLGKGLTPDPVTDGHVDGMAAFARPGVVLLHSVEDKADPNHKILADAKRRLQEAKDAKGRRLEVIDLPLAEEVGQMNFYVCNGAVIVPVSGDPSQDDEPLGILEEVFPEREIIPVPGNVLAKGGGGVHCITQQIPAVAKSH